MRKTTYLLITFFKFSFLFSQTPATIYTPQGSVVSDSYIYSVDLTPVQISANNEWVRNNYPNATIVEDASQLYNCHAYAWYLSEGNNTKVWLGLNTTTAQQIFWLDGSYEEVLQQSCATKVSYPNGNHSAVTTSIPNVFKSKWGSLPLVIHEKSYCPYVSTGLKYYIKNKYNLTGPSIICNNASYSIDAFNGVNVSWTAFPAGIVTLQSNGNSMTATKITNGDITINAQLTDNCGNVIQSIPLNNIHVGTGNPPNLTLNYDNICGKWLQALPNNYPTGTTGFNWNFTGYKNTTITTSTSDLNGGDLLLTYPQFLTNLSKGGSYYTYLTVNAITSCGNTNNSPSNLIHVGPYNSSNCTPIQILGINISSSSNITDDNFKFNNTNSVLIYPNPSINNINISVPKGGLNLSNATIKILDSFGQIVKVQKNVNDLNYFDISDLLQGVYFVIVSDDKNVYTQKFIKQ